MSFTCVLYFSKNWLITFPVLPLEINFLFLQRLSQNLKTPPDSLEELKIVLSTITAIRGMSFMVELKYLDIWERYRTLAMYDIQVGECYVLSHKTFQI